METILVISTLPDREHAEKLAHALLEQRLAACVNILPGVRSVYRWQGRVESANETMLLIKTTMACYPALEAAIKERHPYELPEIVAVPINAGLPAYLAWVKTETKIQT
jgi:periplasmic divalent cation tolerance protein